MNFSRQEFREVLGSFATGVTVVTVLRDDGALHGMTANSFASVSLEPFLVLVCVSRDARTHDLIHARRRFGINVLAEAQTALAEFFTQPEQDPAVAERLGVRHSVTARGTPQLAGCLGWLDCRLQHAQVAGDHTVFVGEVEEIAAGPGRPLLFFGGGYHRLDGRI